MKRSLGLSLTVLLCAAFAFAGGGQESQAPQAGAENIYNAPGELPIVKDGNDVTVSILTHTRLRADDFDNNWFTDFLEEKTNIQLEFEVASQSDAQQKLNLVMASGAYPGVIAYIDAPFSLGEQALYYEQGILLPLNDYIEEVGLGMQRMFELYPESRASITLEDGSIVTIPAVADTAHVSVAYKLWIYEPWLDNLGLEMPQTTEDYYNVLKAFKEDDPNQNGRRDEIPLVGAAAGWNTQIEKFLMNSFVYNDVDNNRLYVENGRVAAAYSQPGWKTGMEYIRRLVDEDLLAGESFTQDIEQLRTLARNDQINMVGSLPGGSPGSYGSLGNPDSYAQDVTAVPPLEGPDGVRYAWWNVYGKFRPRVWITDAAEYPEAAYRLFDTMLMDYNVNEVAKEATFPGREGLEWRFAEAGEEGYGGPGIWVQLKGLSEHPPNIGWNQQNVRMHTDAIRVGTVVTGNPTEKVLYDESVNKYFPYRPDADMPIPPLVFSEQDAREVAEIGAALNTYVEEMFARFVTRDADLDREWESYLNELENIGLERFLEIHQRAYDSKTR